MAYTYKEDDLFYDAESLDNAFTVAWWAPKTNTIILSYIDDDCIITSNNDYDYIRNHILNTFPQLQRLNVSIMFENIKNTGCIKECSDDINQHYDILGMQTFAKRLGLSNGKTYINAAMNERSEEHNGIKYNAAFYPVKQTDPDYDEHRHGYRFGYNSTNYDMTVFAYLLSGLHPNYFSSKYTNTHILWDKNVLLSAKIMREFNNELFDSAWRSQMPKRLAHVIGADVNGFGDYTTLGWTMHKGWKVSGRFIDVSKLNEKVAKLRLKRLLGTLGLHIMESDKLKNNTHINNLDEFADLLAYNISDVINLQELFEHKQYQNSFNVRGQLLKTYPQTIYAQQKGYREDGLERQVDNGNYMNIRKDRLTRESTSAKFVELALAPYKPIKDMHVVSFMYPSELEAKKLNIQQTDVLEDTRTFFETYVTNDPSDQAHKDFMEVYRFYDCIRGKNFNASKAYAEYYQNDYIEPKQNEYKKELMSTYNTNLFYHHKDENGRVFRSSCLANFSIGGIHGAEINMERYEADLDEYHKEQRIQAYVQSLYETATEAINGEVTIELPEFLTLTERVQNKITKNNRIKIREFMKTGSTKKEAFWKVVPPIDLFKKRDGGKWNLNDKYTFVSVGKSLHGDFVSYYPLLLSRLSVFINPSYHGYKDNGDPADPYYDMFLERVAKKKESKDKTLSEVARDLADIEQESRKLLINAGSGAGDATFDNNIRVNNAIISMRIIGQLFAWRIGQAQTLAGARIPSTNTDGLYTMDIDPVINEQILKNVSKDMYIGIEPEPLDRFVSKDSNNRLEVHDNEIASAKGGTLNSWKGPQPTQSLDHAAIIDYTLAKYLANDQIENPSNIAFDRNVAEQFINELIQEHIQKKTPQQLLLYFQWMLSSSANTHRYAYVRNINKSTGETSTENLQNENRIFLIKDIYGNVRQEVRLAVKVSIKEPAWKKNYKEYENGDRDYLNIWEHDDEALEIIRKNGLDLKEEQKTRHSAYYKDAAKTQKIKTMPDNQAIASYNKSLWELSEDKAIQMINALDIDAYVTITEQTFKSWSNIE